MNREREPLRVQFDMLLKVPSQIDNSPILSKTKRKCYKGKQQSKAIMSDCFRASIVGKDGDNHALSLFFTCPDTRFTPGNAEDEFQCSIRNKTFGYVVPECHESLRSIPFTHIFSLARLLSIYENESDLDRKRYLMEKQSYTFVMEAGVQKAYTFFKRKCEHVMKAF
ncbi:unnamed protein product [Heligmosomoides polygyrus]|uniref:PID domain-containing protein n=1 Tax=Heligmosomoides polygyrus TaxID=6339 RepID=A0A183GMH2_HELPZ|nr:unnamed protein product [Heligmosomoides polygyrus]